MRERIVDGNVYAMRSAQLLADISEFAGSPAVQQTLQLAESGKPAPDVDAQPPTNLISLAAYGAVRHSREAERRRS
jgi:hypothetical protein